MMTMTLIAILMVTLHMDTEVVVLLVRMMKSMFSLVHLADTHIMVSVYSKRVHVHNDNFFKKSAASYHYLEGRCLGRCL